MVAIMEEKPTVSNESAAHSSAAHSSAAHSSAAHSSAAHSPAAHSKTQPTPDRRRFLQTTAVSGAAGLLPMTLTAAGSAAGSTNGQTDQSPVSVQRYPALGRTGLAISDISFGSSRLRSGEEHLVHHALDKGVNYFDTAESYTRGQSETVIGRALKGRRDKVILASKQFAGSSTKKADMMHELEASLRRLQTDYIDVYFNHAVNDKSRLQNPEWFDFIELAKRQGKIGFSGISGHAGYLTDVLSYAIEHDLVDVILAAYNFGQDPAFYERITRSFDFVANQPGLPNVLQAAKAKGIGVIAMKTLMGARLNDLRELESQGNTFAQAAFRWTLSNPNVDALIVSMTQESQIDEYLGASGAQQLAVRDLDLLREYAVLNGTSYCKHACNECSSSCPFSVPIADVLRTRMYALDYGDRDFAASEYAMLAGDASPCLSCDGQPCAGACPHGIDIAQLCAPTHRLLA